MFGRGWLAVAAATGLGEGAPISGMVVVGNLISLGGLTSPDSALMRIASFVPPFAPLTLPARVILGQPGPWELPASLALMAASAYGLIHFGSLTYSGALLRFGERVKLRHAYRSGLERARGTATRGSLPPSPTPRRSGISETPECHE